MEGYKPQDFSFFHRSEKLVQQVISLQPNSYCLLNMETKEELLSEGEKYFEKVMQDFNQNRKGRKPAQIL